MSEQNYPSYLIHYGIEGQKWGVRRFQNDDGTYTSEGLERRRALIESHGLKSDIRKATREGKIQVKYNKILAKSQNAANEKFNKITNRIEKDRKAGLNPSERDIKKAIRFGTEVRKADYIAKDPEQYYKTMHRVSKQSMVAGILGGVYGIPVAGAMAAVNVHKMNKHYNDAFEKARYETIADLKKRKLI